MSLLTNATAAIKKAKRKMALQENPPKNKTEAAKMLGDMGRLRRQAQAMEADMEAEIAAIRERYEALATPIAEKYEGFEKAMLAWAETFRDQLTDGGKRKTVDLGSGSVVWRKLPPSVRIKKVDDVVSAILELGETDEEFRLFVRVKQEPNKEAMLANPDKARLIPGVTIGSAGETVDIVPLVEELNAARQLAA